MKETLNEKIDCDLTKIKSVQKQTYKGRIDVKYIRKFIQEFIDEVKEELKSVTFDKSKHYQHMKIIEQKAKEKFGELIK